MSDALMIVGTIWRFTTLADGGSRLTLELDIPNTYIYRRHFPEGATLVIAPIKEDRNEPTP